MKEEEEEKDEEEEGQRAWRKAGEVDRRRPSYQALVVVVVWCYCSLVVA